MATFRNRKNDETNYTTQKKKPHAGTQANEVVNRDHLSEEVHALSYELIWVASHQWLLIELNAGDRRPNPTAKAIRLRDLSLIQLTDAEIDSHLSLNRFLEKYGSNPDLRRYQHSKALNGFQAFKRHTERSKLIQEIPEEILSDIGAWWGYDEEEGLLVIDHNHPQNRRKTKIRWAVRCKDWNLIEVFDAKLPRIALALVMTEETDNSRTKLLAKELVSNYLVYRDQRYVLRGKTPVNALGPPSTAVFVRRGRRGERRCIADSNSEFSDYWETNCWKCKKPDLDSYRNEHCDACRGLICDACGACHMRCATQ